MPHLSDGLVMKTCTLHTEMCDLDTRVTAISGLDLLNKDHFNRCV